MTPTKKHHVKRKVVYVIPLLLKCVSEMRRGLHTICLHSVEHKYLHP